MKYSSGRIILVATATAFFVPLFVGCHQSGDRKAGESYRDVAHARLGKNVEYIPNVDSSFVLCIHREELQPIITMSFLVCDARRGTVLFQDSLSQSQVFWSDSTHIRVTPSPEAINGDETPPGGYVFDVRQGKKQ